MLSAANLYNVSNSPPLQASPLPRRTDSLSTSVVKPKDTIPIVRSREDLKFARVVLNSPITYEDDAQLDGEARQRRLEDRERELTDMLGRMVTWVDELAMLLQQAYKNQTDLETALTLTRSNLQLALANNEMLEEALKRGGSSDVGWRRWSDREDVRRTSYAPHGRPHSVLEVPAPSGPSRFFNFKSTLQRVSSPSHTSPTSTYGASPTSGDVYGYIPAASPSLLPSVSVSSSRSSTPPQNGAAWESARPASPPPPSAREQALAAQLSKERAALQALSKEKTQLENELESLSQALFEEANTMVSKANRKLAETEEELRIATEQKEALRGALRIVEGENGQLRGLSPIPSAEENDTPRITISTASSPPASATLAGTHDSFWSPVSPSPVSTRSSQSPSPSPSTTASTSTHNAIGHRWSVIPQTPRSRSVVQNQFEQAMQRMHALVGEEGEQSEDGVKETAEQPVETHKSDPDSAPIDEHLTAPTMHPPPKPRPVSPRPDSAILLSSESTMEGKVTVGSGEHNPWTF